jgi:nucleoside-diphosphate-sugar epimerase
MAATAVVSGGGTGIGAAVTAALVTDGYQVVIVGRRAEVLAGTVHRINGKLGRADAVRAVTADLASPAGAARVASTVDGWCFDLARDLGPAGITAAVRYLVGPGSGYVTGQVPGVNGGSVPGR